MTTLGPAERAVLLAFADDEHLMGQRHTEWIGVAPFLEEDLAFASIGQDELGHAAMLYELVIADLAGEPASAQAVDALAFRRDPADYRSCWLVEAPCTEWATALVRHWLYDTAEALRWRELAGSSDARVRDIAARAMSEERYHLRHADALLDALVGDSDASARVAAALAEMLPLGVALFDDPPGADTAAANRRRTTAGSPGRRSGRPPSTGVSGPRLDRRRTCRAGPSDGAQRVVRDGVRRHARGDHARPGRHMVTGPDEKEQSS